jgi:hypothetical protein
MEFYRKSKDDNEKTFQILDIISFVLLIIVVFIYNQIHISHDISTSVLKSLVNNWKSSPIIEIKKNKGQNCPAEFQSFLEYDYQGSEEGCYCKLNTETSKRKNNFNYTMNLRQNKNSKSESNSDELFIKGKCLTDSKYSCIKINKSGRKTMKFYKKTSFCAKKSNENYMEFYKNFQKKKCQLGMKECGILDNYGNLMCVDQNSNCPINDLQFGNETTVSDLMKDENYHKVKISDEFYLVYSNNDKEKNEEKPTMKTRNYTRLNSRLKRQETTSNKKIFVELMISDAIPCVNPKEINHAPNYSVLWKDYSNHNCSKLGKDQYDKFFTKLDSYKMVDFFTDNNNSIASNLAKLQNETSEMNIYSRPYIGIKYSCLADEFNPLTPDLFVSSFEPVISSLYYEKIYFITVSLIFVQALCVIFKKKFSVVEPGLSLFIYIEILVSVLLLLSSIFAFIMFSFLNRSSKVMNQFSSLRCMDDTIITAVDNFQVNSSKNITNTLMLGMILLINSMNYPVAVIMLSFKKKK